MKNPRSEEEITVDGIRYNIAKGKVVEDENLQQHARGLDSIRGQHQVTAESAGQKNALESNHLQQDEAAIIDLPKRKRKRVKNLKKTVVIDPTIPSYGNYFAKALLPSGFSASAWIFSVLRGITSPLAWLLIALPIIILQTQNLANENINQLLEKAHQLTQNGLVFHATGPIIFAIVFPAAIIFIRVICNAIALHLRITMLADLPARLWPATKLVFHNSLKMLLHGILQIFLLGLVSILALITIFWAIFMPHGHTLTVFSPYIVGLVIFIWLVLLCLLHAKHWLQSAILSSSLKTSAIQRRSWEAVAAYPLRSSILAATSFVLSFGIIVYGVWAALRAISWLNRSVVPSNTRFVLLMSSIFLGVVLVGYIQQTLWSAYASWLNTQYTPSLFALTKESEIKRTAWWPIWVSTYLFVMTLSLIALGIIFVLPVVNTWAVSISHKIPNKIEIPRFDK
ncbi:MAG: hypothetical protein U0516_02275 [Candidatus Saccharibacteria bacterium]